MFAPDRQGFFPALWLQLLDNLTNHDKETWETLKTREEKLAFIGNHSFTRQRFQLVSDIRREKNLEASKKQREIGNKAFQYGDLSGALVSYTRSVMLAPDGTEDLGLAYANRATCLQRLGGYEFSIRDIKLALENHYPHKNRFKIEERRGQCLLALNRLKEARVAFDAALSYLRVAHAEDNVKKKFIKDVNASLQKLEEGEELKQNLPVVTQSSDDVSTEQILQIPDASPMYPAQSATVTFKYEKGRGRYAVAKTKIKAGTTLLNEKPIAWTLHPDKFGTHCAECMSLIKSVIPCRTCCGVSFCSVECRDIASESYHRYECGMLDILVATGLNVYPFLVVKLITRFGFEYLWGLRARLNHDETAGAETERSSEYLSDDFINAFNLVSHEDKLESEEYLLRTFVAAFLLKLLRFNKFFPDEQANEDELDEKSIFIGKLLLHFIITLPQNVHDIAMMETADTRRWLHSNNIKSLGAGVYLTAALYNHSCDPSFMRCNFGKGMVSVANREIAVGEEISECYGQMYYVKSLQQRRGDLKKHYKFDCRCLACLENWPSIKDMKYAQGGKETRVEHLERVRCSECRQVLERTKGTKVNSVLTCLVCGLETKVDAVPLAEISSASTRAEKLLSDGANWQEGIKAVVEVQELFDKWLVAPNLELYNTQISIWRAMWIIVGNKKLVKPY